MNHAENTALVGTEGISSSFVKMLLTPTLPSLLSPINSLAQLLLVEEVLDDIAGNGGLASLTYQFLLCKAKVFILANPELLVHKWLRNGGAVYDLIHEMR